MEVLGFAKHKDFLNKSSKRILGIHLHDIIGYQDHHAPGVGQIDFESLKRYLKKGTIKVIEAHKQASQSQVKEAKVILEEIFNERD